jgi:hypothetical protein
MLVADALRAAVHRLLHRSDGLRHKMTPRSGNAAHPDRPTGACRRSAVTSIEPSPKARCDLARSRFVRDERTATYRPGNPSAIPETARV